MARFRRAGDERGNIFEADRMFLFKHYFEGEDVFDRLKQYYNNHQSASRSRPMHSRTPTRFSPITDTALWSRYTEEFAVVVKKYTEHPENIFKQSVIHRSVDGYNGFLMTDQAAVDRATREGAIRLTETDFENPF